MKKVVVFVCLFVNGYLSFSQAKEGVINYQVEATQMDTVVVNAQPNLVGSSLDIYFSEEKSRIDFKMNEMMKVSVILDRLSNNGIRLFDGVIGKFYITGLADEMGMVPQKTENEDIQLVEGTKMILGFECKKAIVKSNGVTSVYWYTDKLKFDFSGHEIVNSNLPGFPLEFTTLSKGMQMVFTAINYSAEIENEEVIFSTAIPAGFQEIPEAVKGKL
ncbi:MAG: DUF4412 domain-containing protein [Crocinitomicaceae bacterium]|nr:DUF4412 domain-containing protein [Crocinitomicaceae bacterium]